MSASTSPGPSRPAKFPCVPKHRIGSIRSSAGTTTKPLGSRSTMKPSVLPRASRKGRAPLAVRLPVPAPRVMGARFAESHVRATCRAVRSSTGAQNTGAMRMDSRENVTTKHAHAETTRLIFVLLRMLPEGSAAAGEGREGTSVGGDTKGCDEGPCLIAIRCSVGRQILLPSALSFLPAAVGPRPGFRFPCSDPR